MMNSKDTTILTLVKRIREAISSEALQIVDYWDADNYAIGFSNSSLPNRLVYVSTYKKSEDCFFCELELGEIKDGERNVIKTWENIPYLLMLKEIENFLELQ